MKLGPNSIAPMHQDKPPVWASLFMILVAALGAWAFAIWIVFAIGRVAGWW